MCCKHRTCADDNLGNRACVECFEIRPQLFRYGTRPKGSRRNAGKMTQQPRCKVHRMALWTLARRSEVPFYHTYTDRELRLMLKVEPPDKESYLLKELKEIAKSRGLKYNLGETELIEVLGIDPRREVSNENMGMLKHFEYTFREQQLGGNRYN